ncbi:MAG: BON domain-containing protein [Xanthomonadales bacterium]|nr:BON domain-containing protein [Xanthomonadales bacterium]
MNKFHVFLASMAIAGSALATDKTAGEHIDDSWIHTKVKSALVGEGASTINIEVHNGVVQLAGFVKSDLARDAAVQEAGAVKGVKRISNKLVVESKSRTPGRALDDGVVAARVKKRIAEDERTSSIEINVEVRHGIVLLSGFVDSEMERDAALVIARNVVGEDNVIDGMDIGA